LPDLQRIVVIERSTVLRHLGDPQIMTWNELVELGSRQADRWRDRVASLDTDSTATIVYTSGTTGPPKGAMLSHRNLAAAAATFEQAFESSPDDEVLSYLPLCHVAERLNSAINALNMGYVVNFGRGGASFPTDLRDVQPTIFLGVPRVWEKMAATVEIRMNDASRTKRAL